MPLKISSAVKVAKIHSGFWWSFSTQARPVPANGLRERGLWSDLRTASIWASNEAFAVAQSIATAARCAGSSSRSMIAAWGCTTSDNTEPPARASAR